MKLRLNFVLPAMIAVASLGAIYVAISAEEEKKAEASVAVKTEALEKRSVAEKVEAWGTLAPDVGGSDNISLAAPVQIKRMLAS